VSTNCVQIWAKRRFKTPERCLRAKYRREFELNEKILSNTLWARLEPNGRLVVGAVAKHQPPPPHHKAQSTISTTGTEAAASTAASSDRNDAASVDAGNLFQAAAECPDILVTCADSIDNGYRSSPDVQNKVSCEPEWLCYVAHIPWVARQLSCLQNIAETVIAIGDNKTCVKRSKTYSERSVVTFWRCCLV